MLYLIIHAGYKGKDHCRNFFLHLQCRHLYIPHFLISTNQLTGRVDIIPISYYRAMNYNQFFKEIKENHNWET